MNKNVNKIKELELTISIIKRQRNIYAVFCLSTIILSLGVLYFDKDINIIQIALYAGFTTFHAYGFMNAQINIKDMIKEIDSLKKRPQKGN